MPSRASPDGRAAQRRRRPVASVAHGLGHLVVQHDVEVPGGRAEPAATSVPVAAGAEPKARPACTLQVPVVARRVATAAALAVGQLGHALDRVRAAGRDSASWSGTRSWDRARWPGRAGPGAGRARRLGRGPARTWRSSPSSPGPLRALQALDLRRRAPVVPTPQSARSAAGRRPPDHAGTCSRQQPLESSDWPARTHSSA
jgi:hypothetical protein